MNESGVYWIRNILNDKRYIGSTNNFKRREAQHFALLLSNKHHCTYLQNAYNKYGKLNFVFEIVEYVDDKILLYEREQHWLDNPSITIYNSSKSARSCTGLVKPVIQLDYATGDILEIWPSMSLAAKMLGVKQTAISDVCRRVRRKSAGGYKWQFLFDSERVLPNKKPKQIKKSKKLLTDKDDINEYFK